MNQENLADNLLLIAAGVGINPLLSMMKNVFECHQSSSDASFGKVALYYTATTYEELLFKVSDIMEILFVIRQIFNFLCHKF